jgi:hypothetical protein
MFYYYEDNNKICFLRDFFSDEQDAVFKHMEKNATDKSSDYKINQYIKTQLHYLRELYNTCSKKGLHYASDYSIVPLISHPKYKDKYLKKIDITLFDVMKL